ncbi:MBL fold metallo-hydrolase [Vannielia sp. SX4]|uniref:MBL fold metallo-hydrolase n=1 Tax=Vannielia sp. SX4 TaxID=3463852 RepID=UPI004058C8B9
MEIEFVNHASVRIAHAGTALLTDPWYAGPAFHKGWSLLHETPAAEVEALLARTTHIWISHEHPDHFSPAFFAAHGDTIKARGIKLLFQKIADQRVAGFLRAKAFDLTEMPFGTPLTAGSLTLTCLKDEFYDSALSIRAGDTHILNLNDCAIATRARAEEVRDAVGPSDILLTQFSYAAWKGGPENRAWREEAAREKLENIRLQAEVLTPSTVIPFASFVAFANTRNAYLNDAANRPSTVAAAFADAPFALQVMQPGDTFTASDAEASHAAVAFWEARADAPLDLMEYESRSPGTLREAFEGWAERVHRNNATWAMRLAQLASPIRVFQPVTIHCDDIGETFSIDIARRRFTRTEAPADLTMHSESLWFFFSNSFGFDTLTVNGCLEESRPGGFSRAARSLAIENLNNLGIRFGPGLIFERQVIGVFLERLRGVSARMRGKG